MEVIHARCAGLDVHKDTVVACVRLAVDGQVHQEVKTFKTTTSELLALADWLRDRECTHAAMESTGVYWKPVWHVLEDSVTLVLANAMHIRNVPGRKTDVNDAMWIADLLAHGLIRGSFVPPTPVQEMRDLTRTRKQLVREVAQHSLRLQKTLEDANIKLSSYVTDILGVSGRAILEAITQGVTDPEKLVALSTGRLKASRSELVEALRGRVQDHHRFLLRLHLDQIDALNKAVRDVEARLGNALDPFRDIEGLLMTIPGVRGQAAK
jgi:transposase